MPKRHGYRWAVGIALLAWAGAAGAQEGVMTPLPAAVDPGMTIQQAVGVALANHPILRKARAGVEEAQGRAVQAGLYPNPIQNSGNPVQLGGRNSLYSVGINQEVVRAGKIRLDQAAAMQGVRQADLELIRQQYEVLTSVRQQYYILLATQKRVATLSELRKIAQQSESASVRLKQGGQIAENDVLLLRIELRRIEASQRAAEFTARAGAEQLAALIGVPQMKIDRLQGDLSVKLPDFENPRVRDELLATSSLVESVRAEIARNELLLQRAQVEPIPNLNLNGGYQWSPDQPHSQALVGVYFTVPVWDRNQGNIRAAAANVRQSVAQMNVVENDLIRQLAEALGRYRAAQQIVDTYERGILPDAQRTLELSQKGYAAGQFDFLRILQTQRSVVEANLDYISALQERLTAAVAIAGLLQLDQFP